MKDLSSAAHRNYIILGSRWLHFRNAKYCHISRHIDIKRMQGRNLMIIAASEEAFNEISI